MRLREPWIDAARGVALTGVVFHHILAYTAKTAGEPAWLSDADLALDGFRMPMLVGISGLLAAGVRHWPWREVLRRRVGPLALLYVVWAVVGIVVATAFTTEMTLAEGVHQLSWLLVRPAGWAWYLAALPLYIAGAKALAKVPTYVVVPLSAAVFLAALATWPSSPMQPLDNWWWPAEHWVFFVCAERFASAYWAAATRGTTRRAIAAIALFCAAGLIGAVTGVLEAPVVVGCLGVLGTFMGLTAAGAWGGAAWLAWARAIGTRSLGVYAIHAWLAFVLWHLLLNAVPPFRADGLMFPVAFAAAVLAISYALTLLIERFAPVPLLRPWWDTRAREHREAPAPAQ